MSGSSITLAVEIHRNETLPEPDDFKAYLIPLKQSPNYRISNGAATCSAASPTNENVENLFDNDQEHAVDRLLREHDRDRVRVQQPPPRVVQHLLADLGLLAARARPAVVASGGIGGRTGVGPSGLPVQRHLCEARTDALFQPGLQPPLLQQGASHHHGRARQHRAGRAAG